MKIKTKRITSTSHRPRIVLFDFDGTLSSHDTNVEFGKYCFRHSSRPWLFLPVVAAGAVLKWAVGHDRGFRVRKIDIVWRQMVRCFITSKMAKKLAPGFVREHKMRRFGWAAEQVAKERKAGNFVILSSATPSYLILPLVSDMDFDLIIASQVDSKRPWKIKFLNWGHNKVMALEKVIAGRKVVRAYSDSAFDTPMMDLAKEQVWINPKTGCREN
ncbi:MAG: haloacid dehalogenase-like hydrolase [Alphaproteobacteria bacterium]|nr:haloacid dehalogenase-like hydrolase [Alphaproteobacteria bacterium]